jgi:histone chaperone ASF1
VRNRDTEESAPAEYPPEQPEADTLDDDGIAYGAEEAEMEAALEKELAETEAAVVAAAANQTTNGEDHEMAGADDLAAKLKDEDEASEAGSEDLEADSSGSDDEEDEEEGAEGAEADEDMEMAEGDEKPAEPGKSGEQKSMTQQGQQQVMVH